MSTLIIYFAVPTKEQLGSSSKVSLLLTLSLNDQPKRGPDFANNANHKQIKMQKKLKSQTPVVSNLKLIWILLLHTNNTGHVQNKLAGVGGEGGCTEEV